MTYPEFAYVLEYSTDVENEWLPLRVYLDEDMAELAKDRAQVGDQKVIYAIQEVELVS